MVGTCDVANTPEYLVAPAIPAAHVKHSKPGPLKFVSPPKPFQRPTGTNASNSISSAMRPSSRVFGQLTFSVPSIVEIAQPPPRFVENVPSFSLRLLNSGFDARPSARAVDCALVNISFPLVLLRASLMLAPQRCFDVHALGALGAWTTNPDLCNMSIV